MKKKASGRDRFLESELEKRFLKYWKETGIPITTQYQFHPTRKWRFDFAFPESKLAIEIQGYGKGHASYVSMAKDYMKFNEAARLEWRMLFFMRHNIIDSAIHKTIKYVLKILDEEPRQSPASAKSIFERLHRERINERKGFK